MAKVDRKKNIPGPECGRTTPPTWLSMLPVIVVGTVIVAVVVDRRAERETVEGGQRAGRRQCGTGGVQGGKRE